MHRLAAVNKRYLRLPILLRLVVSTLTICIVLVVTQDLQIFPTALHSLFEAKERNPATLPKGVESVFVNTTDKERIELWRYPAPSSTYAAIIFHGNAGTVDNFFPYQQGFHGERITSYGVEYRGYGKSTGWPSEQGFYNDAEAAIEYVKRRESIDNDQLIILGVSVGTGPAAYAAHKFAPGALVLLSPFTSLPDAAREAPLMGYLHPFVWHQFPVKNYVSKLQRTCLVVAHGVKDKIIPYPQGKEVFESYDGTSHSVFITATKAGHNDILRAYRKILGGLQDCFSAKSP